MFRSVIVFLFVFPVLAENPAVWKIPVELHPKDSLTLTVLSDLLTCAQDENSAHVTVRSDEQNPHWYAVPSASIPGVIQDIWRSESSGVDLVKDWKFSLAGDQAAVLTGGKTTQIKEGEGCTLPPGEAHEVELRAQMIPAYLWLSPNPVPASNNPVRLQGKKAPGGSMLEFQILGDISAQAKVNVLFLNPQGDVIAVQPLSLAPKQGQSGSWGNATVPSVHEGLELRSKPLNALTVLTDPTGKVILMTDVVRVSRRVSGLLWGLFVVALVPLLVFILWKVVKRGSTAPAGEPGRGAARMIWHLLRPAVTPLNRYSISLAQGYLWTLILLWSLTYVYVSRTEFLTITGQMLSLLGIAGATAVSAKVAAIARQPDVPAKYLKEVTRVPRLFDLISIGGQANLFKVQIFAFTLLIGMQALIEVYTQGNFPTLDDNYLTLMGISSGVYVANEFTSTDDVKTVKQQLSLISKKEEAKLVTGADVAALDNQIQDAEKPLKEALQKIYEG